MVNYRTLLVTITLLAVPHHAAARVLEPSVVVNMGALASLASAPAAPQTLVAPPTSSAPQMLVALPAPAIAEAPSAEPAPQQLAMLSPTPQAPGNVQPITPELQSPARAATSTPLMMPPVDRGYIEAGGSYQHVSDDFGDWSGGYVLGEWQATPDHRLNAEISYASRFDDEGLYAAIGDTYTINDRWYASLNLGTSTDGFFLPKYRADVKLFYKWLDDGRLVTSIGYTDYKAREVYHDRAVSLGAIYYFEAPWIVEGGVRYNTSSPGSVDSFSQFIALTQGRYKQHFITARYGFGDESYQIIAPGNPISDFSSDEVSLTWKQWLAEDWGFNIRGEGYDNPTYDRYGMSVGIFKEF